jgi:GntR family transcriptional regulator
MTSDRPALGYRGVADVIRREITSGELPSGAALPSESELGERFGISRGTARLALTVIVNEGLATGGQGRTRRVRHISPLVVYASRSESIERRTAASVDAWVSDVKEQGHDPAQDITVEVVQAHGDVARWLDLEPGSLVAVRRRIRTIDGVPDNLNDTYYPMELVGQFPEILNPADVPQGIIALMESRGVVQVRYTDELKWRPPLQDEAARLSIPSGVAVLVQARTGYTAERAVKCTVTAWPGHTHTMIYELPA